MTHSWRVVGLRASGEGRGSKNCSEDFSRRAALQNLEVMQLPMDLEIRACYCCIS
jgi:hypothetical protein